MGCCLVWSEVINNHFVSLMVSIFTGALFYWTGSHVFHLEGYQEIMPLVKARIKK